MGIFNTKNDGNSNLVLTVANLKTEAPDVYADLHGMGVAEANKDVDSRIETATQTGYEKGYLEGKARGAVIERERVIAVSERGRAAPGYENEIREMMADGKTTGAEASDRILMAMKDKREKNYQTMKNESERPLGQDHEAEAKAQENKEKAANKGNDFKALITEYKAKHKCSNSEAMKALTKSHPEEYQKYLANANK